MAKTKKIAWKKEIIKVLHKELYLLLNLYEFKCLQKELSLNRAFLVFGQIELNIINLLGYQSQKIDQSDNTAMSEITNTFRMTIMGLMILSGAINTIAYKFQNTQYVNEGGYYKLFFHPYMQATTMFFGQFLAIFVYFFMKKKDPEGFKMRMLEAKSKGLQVEFNRFWLAIPAISDFITSTLQYVALNFISGSVYQMMRGGSIVTTLIFSVIFLKSKVMKNQLAGAGLVLIGVMIVGLSNMVFKDQSGDGASAGLQIVGYLLIILSLFTNGFLFVFEQKLLSKYHLEPLQVVGYEGMFGLAIEIVLLPILTFVPCGFGVEACVFSQKGMPFLERPERYFAQIGANGALLFFCILGIFSIATFNICGVTVTKYINALARSIGDVTRTVLVWAIGIIVTVTAGVTRPNLQWELTNAGAILVELLGFIILVTGNLIYNKVIKLPFLEKENKQNPLLQENEGSMVTVKKQGDDESETD